MIQMPIADLAPEQRSQAWHEQRLGRVTGSEVSKVFLDPSDTAINAACRQLLGVGAINAKVKESPAYLELRAMDPYDLFAKAEMAIPETMERMQYRRRLVGERLTGMRADPDPYVTHDMRWGVVNEAKAKIIYQMTKKRVIREAPFIAHPTIQCGASPDGFTIDLSMPEGVQEGTVEIKCLRTANHLYKAILAQDVPAEYLPQIDMEMWMADTSWTDFIAHDSRLPRGLQTLIVRVYRDRERESKLIAAVERFLLEVDADEEQFRKLERMVGHV